jgi:hypothetical protein
MMRGQLVLVVVAMVCAAAAPITAQPMHPPSASEETALIGLPVYSSDGQKLGDVTQVSMADNQLVANFGNFLGFGPVEVLIPGAMFVHKADRIEVKLTAAEVKDRLVEPQKR